MVYVREFSLKQSGESVSVGRSVVEGDNLLGNAVPRPGGVDPELVIINLPELCSMTLQKKIPGDTSQLILQHFQRAS